MAKHKAKQCARCGTAFSCQQETGCWCSSYNVPIEKLKYLHLQYANCLCPDCLVSFANTSENKTCDNKVN